MWDAATSRAVAGLVCIEVVSSSRYAGDMIAKLSIPRALRSYCGGVARLSLSGESVSDLLRSAAAQYPELGPRILDETGELRSHLVVLRGDSVLRGENLARARIEEGEELRLFTAVSGG